MSVILMDISAFDPEGLGQNVSHEVRAAVNGVAEDLGRFLGCKVEISHPPETDACTAYSMKATTKETR